MWSVYFLPYLEINVHTFFQLAMRFARGRLVLRLLCRFCVCISVALCYRSTFQSSNPIGPILYTIICAYPPLP